MAKRELAEVVFLARSLERGGSERQLVTLARTLSDRGHGVTLILFYGGGPLEEELGDSSVRLITLRKRGRWDVAGFGWRFIRTLRGFRGVTIHGYLTVPNLLLALAKPFLRGSRLVWGLRASDMDMSRYDWLSRLTSRLECLTSNSADLVIANSFAGKRHAVARGFPEEKIVVIPNGINIEVFHPDPDERKRVRSEWNVAPDEVLVGLAARLDPMKDHPTFLKAAAAVQQRHRHTRFVLIGDGPRDYRESLHTMARTLGIADRVIWAGTCSNMAAAYNALDIFCSASSSEGFSNSIAEAMACGIPCVVTDVGDSALIVGETGRVVPPRDPPALADAILTLAGVQEVERKRLGARARRRIESEFSVDRLVENTAQALGLAL